jgi:hypothetical protein
MPCTGRVCPAGGRAGPECYIPPSQVLKWRATLELYHDLRLQHIGWAQPVHAVCFQQGTTALGEDGVVRTSRPRLASIVDEQLSAVGRPQLNTALFIMDAWAEHRDRLRMHILADLGWDAFTIVAQTLCTKTEWPCLPQAGVNPSTISSPSTAAATCLKTIGESGCPKLPALGACLQRPRHQA